MDKTLDSIRNKYNNGMLITEKEWDKLDLLINKVNNIIAKEGYLKANSTVDDYVEFDIEEFSKLREVNSTLMTIVLDLEDYLTYKNGDTEVFQSDSEALIAITRAFEKLDYIKNSTEDYSDLD